MGVLVDGQEFVSPETECSWSSGFLGLLHVLWSHGAPGRRVHIFGMNWNHTEAIHPMFYEEAIVRNLTRKGIVRVHCATSGGYRTRVELPDGEWKLSGPCGRWYPIRNPTTWERIYARVCVDAAFLSVLAALSWRMHCLKRAQNAWSTRTASAIADDVECAWQGAQWPRFRVLATIAALAP